MNKQIDKLAWLYIKNNKLLVARSKNKTAFYVPGGKREPGEDDQQALIREVKEELSVDLLTESIRYAETFTAPADGKTGELEVKLTCYFADFIGELAAAAEIEIFDFISYEQKSLTSTATHKVMEWLKAQSYFN